MTSLHQVSQALDGEHRLTLALLGRVEQALMRAPRAGGARQAAFAALAREFSQHIEQDIGRHFEFEERELFPRLADAGDGGIAELLREEHDAIREVAAEILPLSRKVASLDDKEFAALERGTLEMLERQVAHIQKESMALLPLLDELLDDDTDRELAFAYASN